MPTIRFVGGPRDGQTCTVADEMPGAVSFGTDTGTVWYLPGAKHEDRYVQDYDYDGTR